MIHYLRDREVDLYIEMVFGTPNWNKSFINEIGELCTPIGNKFKLWRVDRPEKGNLYVASLVR